MPARIGAYAGAALLALAAAQPAAAMRFNFGTRLDELRAVLDGPGLSDSLGANIDRIEWIGNGLYRVTAFGCHIDVRLVVVPRPHGLIRYVVTIGQRVCGP